MGRERLHGVWVAMPTPWNASFDIDSGLVHELFFRRWAPLRTDITASPALGKIATSAGILPGMTLAVRAPYQAGDEHHVQALMRLVSESFSEFAIVT